MERDKTRTASADSRDDADAEVVRIGAYTLDRVTGELSKGGDIVVLQPSSLGVLSHLIDHAGQVVSSDALIETVWPNRIIGDDAVHRRIADLRKQLGDDARKPQYIETLPRRGYRLIVPVSTTASGTAGQTRKRRLLTATPFLLMLPIAGYIYYERQTEIDYQAHLETIAALVEKGDAFNTFLEVREIHSPGAHPTLRVLTAKVLEHGRLETEPDQTDVWLRWRLGDPWHYIGTTPLEMDFPVGVYSIRLEKPGYASRTILEANPGVSFNNTDEGTDDGSYRIRLLPREMTNDTTVLTQGGEFLTPFIMTRERYALDDFLIDRHEVTNSEFRVFLDADGYQDPGFWSDYPFTDTQPPAERFTDSTGETGPASWEFGTYPTGMESLPVTGISWYEAQAYNRWSGRHLPTAFDWSRAALSTAEWEYPIASVAVESANIESDRLLPVGSSGSLTASGAADLIGNAREWTSSVTHDLAILIGGSFDSPRVQYAFPLPTDPFDRSLTNGFRSVTYLGERNAQLTTSLDWEFSGDVVHEPVSNEAFEGIKAVFTYEPGAVGVADGRVMSTTDEGDWERRVIQLPTVDADDPLPVHLFVPKDAEPPYQAVFFVPPSDSFGSTISTSDIALDDYFLDVIVRDGRVLVWPVYTGTHERFDDAWSRADDAFLEGAARNQRRRRNEVGRVIDYLQDHPEFDGSKIGMIARGFGATFTVPSILALESRIRAVVLWNPLYPHGRIQRTVINPATFWPRMRQPVFAASGRDHHFSNRQADPTLLMQMIGTASEHKVLKVFDGPHWPLPRRELLADTIDWLDRYLGAPGQSTTHLPERL